MRNTLIAVLLFLGLSAEKCNQIPGYSVNLSLTQTEAYCGGAMPPPELIKDLATPKPYSGPKVYVFGDDLVCIDSTTADETNIEALLLQDIIRYAWCHNLKTLKPFKVKSKGA